MGFHCFSCAYFSNAKFFFVSRAQRTWPCPLALGTLEKDWEKLRKFHLRGMKKLSGIKTSRIKKHFIFAASKIYLREVWNLEMVATTKNWCFTILPKIKGMTVKIPRKNLKFGDIFA